MGDVIDPFSDFKACVEENKLTGLMFQELWVDGTAEGATFWARSRRRSIRNSRSLLRR